MTSNDPRPDGSRPEQHDASLYADAEPTYVPESQPGPYAGYQPGYQQDAGYQPGYQQGGYGYPGHEQWTTPSQYGPAGYAQQYAPGYQPQQGYPGYSQPGGYAYYPGAYTTQYGTPAPAKQSPARKALLGVAAAALAAGLVLSGVAIADSHNSSSTTAQGSTGGISGSTGGSNGSGGSSSGGITGGGSSGNSGTFPGGSGSVGGSGGVGGSGTSTSATIANATQQKGIVTVVSVLGYQGAESAGTGMILTSSGEILTNNHVVSGATSITVTVESTGRSYRADVVGTVPTKDVAVLQLRGASGLTTAKVGDSSDVDDLKVGDAVTGVGNAGGTGTLRAASGKVTALNQSITASDESGSSSEKLHGLIQINAGIISGDSGGPLYASDGEIVGMDTAASANSAQAVAYAIPIDEALSLADQIESGNRTSTVHIGLPAFIGIYVNIKVAGGAGVQSVNEGGPADKAGITAGSVITAVNGSKVANAAALKAALATHRPGDKVSLTWTDASGQSHTATVTTVAGPAD